MAYVPSFEHDVFVSYAHGDNAGASRVSAFHCDLVAGIQSRLGNRAFHRPEEWVFFDQLGLRRGDEVSPRLERSARRSAVLISLVSPSYLQSPYCIQEMNWFLESKGLAIDPIERRLIPIVFTHTSEDDLRKHPHLTTLIRGSLCTPKTNHPPSSTEWHQVLEELAWQIADHLKVARRQHGAVFVGPSYPAAAAFRAKFVDELRGFRCTPENGMYGEEDATKQALAEAKLAVHLLGDTGDELANSIELLQWSLDHCQGKTIGLLPPGRALSEDERQFLERIRYHANWSQPQGTIIELADLARGELEAFRMPDPSTPIGLACDLSDLDIARSIAREIHEQSQGAYRVETPDFLANPQALFMSEWKKFRSKRQGVVLYWANGQKQQLDSSVGDRPLAAALGRVWYVSVRASDPQKQQLESKREWQPPDPETKKILDEDGHFQYQLLKPFLESVRRRASD